MNFLTMDYFITVAREQNITRAAQQLHITQQTLSAHISALERELGVQLFIRNTPLRLTYAGEVFLRYAREFQGQYISLQREFCDIVEHQRGKLQVGVSYTRGHLIMPAIIAAFQREYPHIQISLREGNNERLTHWALEGEVDLAIAAFPTAVQGLELSPFYDREVVLLVPDCLLETAFGASRQQAEASLASGDLSPLGRLPFILGRPDDINGQVGLNLFRQQGLRPDIRAQTENVETLLSLCLAGIGAGFCPEDLIPPEAHRDGSLRLFRLGPEARFSVRFGYLRRSYQWSILSEFIRVARETLSPEAG